VDVAGPLVVVLLLLAVVWALSAPLRGGWQSRALDETEGLRADLEAEKEAKYREIREAELDHRTGKLSDADWRAVDRALRREAVEVLRRLDELDGGA
jgi:hypothetical protein